MLVNNAIYASVKEAAKRVGVSQYYIRTHIAVGDIPVLTSGTKQYINVPRLIEQLSQKEQRGH